MNHLIILFLSTFLAIQTPGFCAKKKQLTQSQEDAAEYESVFGESLFSNEVCTTIMLALTRTGYDKKLLKMCTARNISYTAGVALFITLLYKKFPELFTLMTAKKVANRALNVTTYPLKESFNTLSEWITSGDVPFEQLFAAFVVGMMIYAPDFS